MLEYLLNPCTLLDARLHPGLDLEVGSSLNDEYSVTRVATMCSRGGASGRSGGGRLEWAVGWVCGRGFIGIVF